MTNFSYYNVEYRSTPISFISIISAATTRKLQLCCKHVIFVFNDAACICIFLWLANTAVKSALGNGVRRRSLLWKRSKFRCDMCISRKIRTYMRYKQRGFCIATGDAGKYSRRCVFNEFYVALNFKHIFNCLLPLRLKTFSEQVFK